MTTTGKQPQKTTDQATPSRAPARRVPYRERSGAGTPATGTPPADVRGWLAAADAIGGLRVIEGADAEEGIGRVSEMLHHTDESPAVLFDAIPGYEPGYRVLVNSLGARGRLAMTLGLDPSTGVFELMDEWERKLNEVQPIPVEIVESGPILENIQRGDDVDLLKLPTPLWHPEDGGPYIGTGCGGPHLRIPIPTG